MVVCDYASLGKGTGTSPSHAAHPLLNLLVVNKCICARHGHVGALSGRLEISFKFD